MARSWLSLGRFIRRSRPGASSSRMFLSQRFMRIDYSGAGCVPCAMKRCHDIRRWSEIFRGGSIPAGNYSLLLRGAFQSGERTLREDEVGRWSEKIIKALEGLGGTLRAG